MTTTTAEKIRFTSLDEIRAHYTPNAGSDEPEAAEREVEEGTGLVDDTMAALRQRLEAALRTPTPSGKAASRKTRR